MRSQKVLAALVHFRISSRWVRCRRTSWQEVVSDARWFGV